MRTDTEKLTDFGRRVQFSCGFGDGAKSSAIKYPDDGDYMEGFEAGLKSRSEACEAFRLKNNLQPQNILRAMDAEDF